jgi:hypothetical protein
VNKLLYLKVFVMVAALAGVIYVMTHLSPDKVETSLKDVGLTPPAQQAAPGASAEANGKVNLCQTRVHAIVWPDGRKIQEASGGLKAKWQAYNLNPVDIGSMDVEKWLSLHCEVAVRDADASASAAVFGPYVTFSYIDGTQENLERAPDGAYRFKTKTFTSDDLTKAMSDLVSLANLEPLGP